MQDAAKASSSFSELGARMAVPGGQFVAQLNTQLDNSEVFAYGADRQMRRITHLGGLERGQRACPPEEILVVLEIRNTINVIICTTTTRQIGNTYQTLRGFRLTVKFV